MTHTQALSLLEDYVDNELPPEQAVEFEIHLRACDDCRAEVESSRLLKTALRQSNADEMVPDPGPSYWPELTSLVLAKTVDAEPEPIAEPVYQYTGDQRRAERRTVIRSAMLFAASLALLLGALYLGSHKAQISPSALNPSAPVMVVASLSDLVDRDNTAVVTAEERASLLRGMLALGAPGPLGRIGLLTDISARGPQ